MSADTRMNSAPNLIFGISLIFVGVALVLDRMQVVDAGRILRFWPIGLVLLGGSMIGQAFFRRKDGSSALENGLCSFHAGHVLGILLVGIVVTQAFRGRETDRADSSGTVSLLGVMSGDERVSHAASFHGADMTSVMGNCTLDLRQATLAPGEDATIDVLTLMGGLVLRVPEGWQVDVRAVPIMGGVRDQRPGARGRFAERRRTRDGDVEVNDVSPESSAAVEQATPPAGGSAPRIVLRGFIVMGGLVIKS